MSALAYIGLTVVGFVWTLGLICLFQLIREVDGMRPKAIKKEMKR